MFFKCIFLLIFNCYIERAQAYVLFQNSGPTVLGANVTFEAVIRDDYKGENLKFMFYNEEMSFYKEIFSTERVVNFTVEFNKKKYKAGHYIFQVIVTRRDEDGIYRQHYGVDRSTVILTDLLNGHLMLTQNGIDMSDGVVIANEPVKHIIKLSERELQFVTKDKSYVVIWYLNCSIIRMTQEFSLVKTYYDGHDTYNLEVLVVVDNEPLLHTINKTTTTTTITTTTTTTATPNNSTTTTAKPNNSTTTSAKPNNSTTTTKPNN